MLFPVKSTQKLQTLLRELTMQLSPVCLFFLAFSFLTCPQTQACKVGTRASVLVLWQPGLGVLHDVCPELHLSVLSLDAIVGAYVCIRKSPKWFQYISESSVLSTALINTVQKEPERDREVIPDLFIKTDLFQSFKFYNPNCLRSMLSSNCV